MARDFRQGRLSEGVRRAAALVSLGDFARNMSRIDQALRLRGAFQAVTSDERAGADASIDRYLAALNGLLIITIRRLTLEWLLHYPANLDHPAFAAVTLSFRDAEDMPRADRLAEVVRQISDGDRHKPQIDRLDGLLRAAGLAGPIDPSVRRDLIELSHVDRIRRRARDTIDHRLKRACPWLDVMSGQPLIIAPVDCRRYGDAAKRYVLAVVTRTRASRPA